MKPKSDAAIAVLFAILFIGTVLLAMAACSGGSTRLGSGSITPTGQPSVTTTSTTAGADVIEVSVSGTPGDYSVSVTVKSPDIGCQSYADWWEVISEGGELLTRRVLLHSHVDEQPFTRSGGPLTVQPDETVIVRAHMSDTGYGGAVMRGTVEGGFSPASTSPGFASGLETQAPIPTNCAF
ncbi:MAG: hypothetical protein H8E48_11840 [Chloroflexi bacterium]|nr:hypothetical protein [Chloroflexota bacterium]